MKISQARVRELFGYREGKIFWIKPTSNRVRFGLEAGSITRRGYKAVSIDGRLYLVHRIIWLWHHGYLPENGIDHIDKNKNNNKIENLREVSQQCNVRNSSLSRSSKTGVRGVSWNKQKKRWCSTITVGGSRKFLGYTVDFFRSVENRLIAEEKAGWQACDRSSSARQYMKKNACEVGP